MIKFTKEYGTKAYHIFQYQMWMHERIQRLMRCEVLCTRRYRTDTQTHNESILAIVCNKLQLNLLRISIRHKINSRDMTV